MLLLITDNMYVEEEGSILFVAINNQYLQQQLQQDPQVFELAKKLNDFLLDNDDSLTFCRYGEASCASSSCFYVKTKETKGKKYSFGEEEENKMKVDEDISQQRELEILERLKNSEILAYCKIVKTVNLIGEIYSVCLKKGESKAETLLTKVLNIYFNLVNSIWLAVDFYNPSWDDTIKLYTGLGFADPKVTTRT